MSFRAVLGERGFLGLWLAQLVSRLGDAVHEIALIWIVYEVTGDPSLVALVVLASVTPSLVLSLPAGALVDRWNRKRVLLVAEASRGLAVLAIPLVGEGPFLVPVVLTVALYAGAVEAFFSPAQQALLPRLVPASRLDSANSLVQLTTSVSRSFYALGGVVVGVGGSFLAFYLNAASFLLAAAFVLLVPASAGRVAPTSGLDDPAPTPRGAMTSVLADVREGLAFIRGSPVLLAAVAMGVFVDFAAVPLTVVLPAFAETVLGGGSTTFGFLLGAFFVGTFLGGLAVNALRGVVAARRGLVIVAATVGTGVGIALAGVLPARTPAPLLVALAAFAFAGVCNPLLNVPLTSYVQAVVPDETRGKVFSVLRVGITGAAPLGIALAGPAVELLGASATLVAMGAVIVLAGIAALATPLARLGADGEGPGAPEPGTDRSV